MSNVSHMTVVATIIPSPITISKYRLVEQVLHEGNELSVRVRAQPENVAWSIKFTGVIGYRAFDERDFLRFFPQCSTGALFEVKEGGWLQEAMNNAEHLSFGFYGEAHEYFVAGESTCVGVIATDAPVVAACG